MQSYRVPFLPYAGGLLALTGTLLCAALRAPADTPIKPDSGKFVITVQEAPFGNETFKIAADGSSTSDTAISFGGRNVKLHSDLKLKQGQLSEVTTDGGKLGKFTLTVDGAKSTWQAGDQTPHKTTLPDHVFPYDDVSPHLFTYLLSAYDAKKGGAQKFTLLAVSAMPTSGPITLKVSVTALNAKPRELHGKTVALSRYSVVLAGPIGNIDTEVDTDKDGHILFWTVPGQKLVGIREGYEELAKPEKTDSKLSQPTFTVKIEKKVMVAMRDGVHLATDIYRPDAPGTYPVILQRTPYGRENAVEANFYAKRGYVFIAQDVRGRFDSEGDWHPFVMEAKDGYDSVEWCASQPWSDGNVGMIGGSYLGFVQWAAAREGNKHLKCLIPIVSPPDPFFNVPYASGALLLTGSMWWGKVVMDKNENHIESPASTLSQLEAFKTLPVTDIDKKLFGKHLPYVQEWLQHPTNDSYWQQVNFNDRMKDFAPLPALHVSGWFDGDGIGTKLNYAAMVAAGQTNQKLIYGPWTHAVNTTSKIGNIDFGPDSLRDLDTVYLRWFDHWLKGIDNGIEKEPPVEAFLMGENKWRSFSAWPPKEAQVTRWYLHSKGHANTDKSDGTLSTTPPGAKEPEDHYSYNPADPYIPSIIRTIAKTGNTDDILVQQTPERDPKLLDFTSEVLKEDLVIAGPIALHLSAASSARDTDWFATLQDITPDGKAISLIQGILRARFRNSFEKPMLLTPGEVADYDLDLWAIGNIFKKGHRLRVLVTSSCFPAYDRNLNTGEDNETTTKMVVAKQTLYHNTSHPSYVTLPTLSN
ncbi:MAG TPA: CocE/NonD family hydrolase [Chthonomonadaceae bacterium]|nr:CocE/NonD family hydrolase [Chthonomonadaceae bacterium]